MAIYTTDRSGTFRGSCKDPYGGLINPARIDWIEFVESLACANQSKQSGAKLFATTVISHSSADFLFFGFGRNGYHKVERFWEATEFMFRTRSTEPETWKDAPPIEQIFVDPETGKRVKSVVVPPPETLRAQCFDRYYEVAELDLKLSMDDFLDQLKETRRGLVVQNLERMQEFLEFRRRNALASKGGQLRFVMESLNLKSPGAIDALVCPQSPEELEAVLPPFGPLPERARLRRVFGKKLNSGKRSTYKIIVPYGQQEFVLSDAA